MTETALPKLTPLLIVRDAVRAIDFYVQAFGGRVVVRYMNKALGTVSHADLAIGEAVFSVTEEARAWNSDAPPSLGGSPVVEELSPDELQRRRDVWAPPAQPSKT